MGKIKEKMIELQSSDDPEMAHIEADNILLELLIFLGYSDIVKEYEKIDK